MKNIQYSNGQIMKYGKFSVLWFLCTNFEAQFLPENKSIQ